MDLGICVKSYTQRTVKHCYCFLWKKKSSNTAQLRRLDEYCCGIKDENFRVVELSSSQNFLRYRSQLNFTSSSDGPVLILHLVSLVCRLPTFHTLGRRELKGVCETVLCRIFSIPISIGYICLFRYLFRWTWKCGIWGFGSCLDSSCQFKASFYSSKPGYLARFYQTVLLMPPATPTHRVIEVEPQGGMEWNKVHSLQNGAIASNFELGQAFLRNPALHWNQVD